MGSDSKRTARVVERVFEVGDLVTLSPDFRYSISFNIIDFGRYLGIVIQAYANREYLVVWTNHPFHSIPQGMFNGDHLIKVENVDVSLMRS